jgi:hypothetical protein
MNLISKSEISIKKKKTKSTRSDQHKAYFWAR